MDYTAADDMVTLNSYCIPELVIPCKENKLFCILII